MSRPMGGRNSRIPYEELVSLVRTKYSDREIARRVGVTRQAVWEKRMKVGLESGYDPRESIPIHIFSDFEKGWLSALIDGEGTITLSNRGTWIQPLIKIDNTNREFIERARAVLTPYSPYFYRSGRKKGQKDDFGIGTSGQGNVVSILHNLLPHLIVKRKVAEKVFQFCRLRMEKRRSARRYGPPYSEEEWKLYREVRELNKRGRRSVL